MNGGIFGGIATLFNRRDDGTYRVSLLTGIALASSAGVNGGDASPVRSVTLYWFDTRSTCPDGKGGKRKCVTPSEWAALTDTSGSFTFDGSGGDWLDLGDQTDFSEPNYASAYRIVSVARMKNGRRHMWHYKVNGV